MGLPWHLTASQARKRALDSIDEGRKVGSETRAKEIGTVLNELSYVNHVLPVDTNIVIFELAGDLTSEQFLAKLLEHNIKAVPFGAKEIRFVTHLDFDDRMLERTVEVLKELIV